jgi:hypothetical protein
MTKDEIVKRIKAGERVTLYHPMMSIVGVGSRTIYVDPHNNDCFLICYDKKTISRGGFKIDSPFLDTLYNVGQTETLWWIAYARSVAINEGNNGRG